METKKRYRLSGEPGDRCMIDNSTGKGISLSELANWLRRGDPRLWRHVWGNTPLGFAADLAEMIDSDE